MMHLSRIDTRGGSGMPPSSIMVLSCFSAVEYTEVASSSM